MKKGKNISGDERGGIKVAKVNLRKEDWLEEGLLVPAKKKIKE
jgi:hypothetical protein